MPYHYDEATIINIIEETDMVRRFFIKMPDTVNFKFNAGQFIMINLPINSKFTNRSYSIASAPSDDNIFELCIVLKPDGLGTPFEWRNFKPGSLIHVSAPIGKFGLLEPVETDICFIGTGTGIAPLRSMIGDIYNRQVPHRNIYLVSGNRMRKDILYKNEFEVLEKENPEFNFIPVLSQASNDWHGARGYVHSVYEELFADKRPAYFYICGWNDMLRDTRQRLEAMGYDKSAIRFESYD